MIKSIIESYYLAIQFITVATLLAMIPVVAEAVQHSIEFRFGMFSSDNGIQHGSEYNWRLVSGVFKVFAVIIVSVATMRYFLHSKNTLLAFRLSSKAKRSASILLFSILCMVVLVSYGLPMLSEYLKTLNSSLSDEKVFHITLLFLFIMFWLFQSRTLLMMKGVLDDDAISGRSEVRFVRKWAIQSVPVLIVSVLPTMALHYALNWHAVDTSWVQQIFLLSFDSLLVGFMAVLIGAACWVTYRDTMEVFAE